MGTTLSDTHIRIAESIWRWSTHRVRRVPMSDWPSLGFELIEDDPDPIFREHRDPYGNTMLRRSIGVGEAALHCSPVCDHLIHIDLHPLTATELVPFYSDMH